MSEPTKTPWCECEHISHMSKIPTAIHRYGAELATEPTALRDMGTWNLCEHCKTVCHKDNIA